MAYNNQRKGRFGGQNSNRNKPLHKRHGRPKSGGHGGGRNRGNNKKYIDPMKFINHAVSPEKEIKYEAQNTFGDFGLHRDIEKNLEKIGYERPSAIQDQSIHAIIDGFDMLGMANTGTGKTAAFLLPTINALIDTRNTNSVLIMAPTRELATQIDDEFRRFAAGLKLYSTVLVGGANIGRQISQLKRDPHVIIGTPGRLGDLIKRGILQLDQIEIFVLDEVDRMLDMGFVNEIQRIAGMLPSDRQTLAFSATMTPAVRKILEDLLKPDYKQVSVVTRQTNEHIDQNVIPFLDKAEKLELLKKLLNDEDVEKAIIFGETKHGVQRLADHLNNAEFSATAIHGNKSQSQRQRALDDFKKNKVDIMVATDVAARGLDIPNVSHVINFDTPNNYEDYVHRIGRTGRGGKSGKALTFIDKK